MTDKEIVIAEEWVGENGFSSDCNNINSVEANREMVNAFLAGIEAGRPQWHNVADGDLPKENKLYLVAIKDNGLAIAYFNGLHWETKYNLGDFGHCVETVIAWCEIPTFDKE